ncbi:MAG TPA: hypothetical protein VGW38_10115 [Chloroflexota bacterium]|nr:hypothetical protein [Chloroflexota bacterium]
MEQLRRRILLAVDPGVLEGALAKMLSAGTGDEVVQLSRTGVKPFDSSFDAAVVSDQLPDGVRAGVVIMLPDTRGSGGIGTVRQGGVVEEVSITGAEQVIELLEQYVPLSADTPR